MTYTSSTDQAAYEASAAAGGPLIRLTGSRGEINLMVIRLRQSFATVEPGEVYLGDDGSLNCVARVTF